MRFDSLQHIGNTGSTFNNPGLPHPVRSASRVSHPLDGLLPRVPARHTCARQTSTHGIDAPPELFPRREVVTPLDARNLHAVSHRAFLQPPSNSACRIHRDRRNRCPSGFISRLTRSPGFKAWLLTASPSTPYTARTANGARCSHGVSPLQGFSPSSPGTHVSVRPPSMGFHYGSRPGAHRSEQLGSRAAALRSITRSRRGVGACTPPRPS